MTDLLSRIGSDLRDEQTVLDEVVAGLSEQQWTTPTSSPGWTVSDQIGHLTYFDGAAASAIATPETFRRSMEELTEAGTDLDRLTLGRGLAPPELLARWRANRARLDEVASTLTEETRVIWYGPSMSAKSFLTARLMEVWAHGQDVIDAVGGQRQPTDRLRHIAQLGVITRGWTYRNRGMAVPEGDVRVDLQGPSGETWSFGPEDAPDLIRGPALDFCLIVTQRRHVDDTLIEVKGGAARDWMEKAQAFAGAPTDPPARRNV
ncbi:MAG: TIGR03084 family metal-binding protein [Acidimicrobiales bacterium]